MAEQRHEKNERVTNQAGHYDKLKDGTVVPRPDLDPINYPKPSGASDDNKGNFGSRAVPVENVITREAPEPSSVPISGGAFDGGDSGAVVEAVLSATKEEASEPDSGRPPLAPKTTRGLSTHPGRPNMEGAPGEPICY